MRPCLAAEVARNFPSSYLLMLRSHHLRFGALPMRVVVYDEAGDIALDYYTKKDSVSLCPGLEKAQVVEALQEAAFFIMDAPAPSPEGRNFRQLVFEGDQGE
jgi:hypothetical protein